MTIGTVKECKELVLVIDNHEGYAENQPSRLSTSLPDSRPGAVPVYS